MKEMIGYKHKRIWKGGLLALAFVIGVASLLYTNFLVRKLMKEEKKKVELWADASRQLNNIDRQNGDISFVFKVIQQNETVPLILVDDEGEIVSSRNLDSSRAGNPEYLHNQLEEMRAERPPIVVDDGFGNKNYIYYKDSTLVTQLRYYPYVQLFVITLFILVGYMAFSSSRKYEQNRVWVGMAKETAHQLGTPLSSLMGWTEYLKSTGGKITDEIIIELEKDINRLKLVTERFSKIGSVPDLEDRNVFEVITTAEHYLSKRVSRNVKIEVDEEADRSAVAKLNESLFDWVIENLVKNAINAMDKKGKVIFNITDSGSYVSVDITDTGKGIPRSHFKTIFNPGYTTRKRGWGLGLSLVKRIVENYHQGLIYVRSSEVGKGTTFRIKLPK